MSRGLDFGMPEQPRLTLNHGGGGHSHGSSCCQTSLHCAGMHAEPINNGNKGMGIGCVTAMSCGKE